MSAGEVRISPVRILPEILSNKIAAGEVVERPASVVRELLENSLDAGSTRIVVEIEQGGRSLIRVSDNGIGMNRDDALLSIERYATSKISSEDDLFSIRTLGFRGEALPSIASVSKFCLETRNHGSESGIRILMEGGKLKKVEEVGVPVGTQVAVGQLFFNTPARRKFLKSVSSETGHIADTVANIAVSRPDVGFKLFYNEKLVKNWAISDQASRIADVLGRDTAESLHDIRGEHRGVSVSGMIASPRLSRGTSGGIFLYVNRRFVKDRIILHALSEGYSERLMKGRFPVAVVFIRLDPDQVDANVHPAKSEVRFAAPNDVHEAVRMAVSDALNIADRPPSAEKIRSVPQQVSESASSFSIRSSSVPSSSQTKGDRPNELWNTGFFSNLRIIGQLRGTYILCESGDGLILIDQHAAAERVLFEQMKNGTDFGKTAQKLLIPETFELPYGQASVMETLIPELKEAGLEIEHFGGNTFVLISVPTFLKTDDMKAMMIEMTEKAMKTGIRSEKEEFLMLMACHGAIRANRILSEPEMETLLSQLDRCDNPSHCPHGRPTWIRWSTRFLEKSFGRTE